MNFKNSVRGKLTALLVALASALAVVVGAPQASAANRDWLRPDSTGMCECCLLYTSPSPRDS